MSTQDSFLIDIKNTSVYLKGSLVLSNINWTQGPDENWAIIGNNGAGKTTLMKLIFGELIPLYGGTVHWFGNRARDPIWNLREKIGYVSAEFQESYEHNLRGWEVVASGLFSSIGLYQSVSTTQKQTSLEWMNFLGIEYLKDKGYHQMSYGEARRVLLARALVNNPSLLILDEPCNGLDIPTKEMFLRTLEKLVSTPTRLIYVSHHIEEIIPGISHVMYLKGGQILEQGIKSDMLQSEVLSRAMGCRIDLKENGGRYWVTGVD